MKRWVWVLGAVLVLLFLGETGTRLEELKPVQLVYVREENGQVILETDTGDMGEGRDFNCALENMKDRASGRIFLETAELLVLTEDGICCLPQIYEKLRPAAEVCLAEGKLEPEAAAEFLTVHKPDVTLQQLRSGENRLEVLKSREGRLELVKGNDHRKAAADLDTGLAGSAHCAYGLGDELARHAGGCAACGRNPGTLWKSLQNSRQAADVQENPVRHYRRLFPVLDGRMLAETELSQMGGGDPAASGSSHGFKREERDSLWRNCTLVDYGVPVWKCASVFCAGNQAGEPSGEYLGKGSERGDIPTDGASDSGPIIGE